MRRLLLLAILLVGCKKDEDPHIVALRKLKDQICDCKTLDCTTPLVEQRTLINKDLYKRFGGETTNIPPELLDQEFRIDEQIESCLKYLRP
jgi:hypothetical protein